jgi:divinyl protochlorophyllide a 8-vinyl-reductase
VQWLLHALPAALAARVLLQAIRRHAWTFSGSGVFSAHCGRQPGRQVALVIQHNPLCRGVVSTTPTCAFYRATFEHLFKVLVHPDAEVTETACESRGDPACRFNVGW